MYRYQCCSTKHQHTWSAAYPIRLVHISELTIVWLYDLKNVHVWVWGECYALAMMPQRIVGLSACSHGQVTNQSVLSVFGGGSRALPRFFIVLGTCVLDYWNVTWALKDDLSRGQKTTRIEKYQCAFFVVWVSYLTDKFLWHFCRGHVPMHTSTLHHVTHCLYCIFSFQAQRWITSDVTLMCFWKDLSKPQVLTRPRMRAHGRL